MNETKLKSAQYIQYDIHALVMRNLDFVIRETYFLRDSSPEQQRLKDKCNQNEEGLRIFQNILFSHRDNTIVPPCHQIFKLYCYQIFILTWFTSFFH